MNAPHRLPTAPLVPARRAASARSSIVREILKVAMQPDVISLAGGLPAPESFPVEALRAAFDAELRDDALARQALQYSTTEGHLPLREWIAAQETARGVPTAADEVLVVAGSQQALDLLGKAFAEPGAPMLVESPTYLGALQAFNLFEPDYRALPTDDDGLVPEAIDAALARDARVLYVMPNFQNPTGRSLSAARRASLAQAARTHGLWLIEDDPYGELWYAQAPPPSLRAYAPERTIRVCSFSKVLAPGLRLGFVIAPRECIELLVRLKQATDLHTATLTQRAAHRVLADGLLDRHLPGVRSRYAAQAQVMQQALAASMPAGVRWTQPAGGMFVWLTLPAPLDAMALLPRAVERKIAFVPGAPFFAQAPQPNTLRLSFVTVAPERIRQGVAVLGDLLREAMR
ncbi:MAG: PLP-dependent aminotransferase family protein [Burkholderiaceae bacterium]|jgi:2-aminoadipate transaminase|nr:PLP-dependent aminotransferase family protein [Burkholderiaceae bacterium]